MAENFVTICVACSKGVTKEQLEYANGRAFHKDCYKKYGKDFAKIDPELLHKKASTKVELVQLRNLKARKGPGRSSKPASRKARKTSTRKARKTSTRKARKTSTRKARKTRSKRR